MSDLPLTDRRIVVTRSAQDAESLTESLQALGAQTIVFPTIRIEGIDDWSACDEALENMAIYTWIVFSSQNSVRFFLGRLREKNVAMTTQKIAALGSKTAAELGRYHVKTDFVPETYTAAGFLHAFAQGMHAGEKVLLPVSDIARTDLYDGLKALGARPHSIVVYRTVPNHGGDAAPLKSEIENGAVDCLTFFSPSAFMNFIEIFGHDIIRRIKGRMPDIAAIGPTTADAMRRAGVEPDIVPENSTEEHLVRAIAAYYSTRN
jgi:uroporphyrinogen-III synthase